MDKQTYSGRTLDDAIEEAARSLGTEKSLVSYNVLNASKEGGLFAKLFNRGVKIEAWVDTDQTDLEAAAREAVRAGLMQNQPPQRGTRPSGTAPAGKMRGTDGRKGWERRDDSKRESSAAEPSKEPKPRSPAATGDVNKPASSHARGHKASDSGRNPSEPHRARHAPQSGQRPPRAHHAEGSDSEPKGLELDAPGVMDTLREFTSTFLKSYDIEPSLARFNRIEGDVVVQVDDKHLEELLGQTDKLSHAFEHVFKRIAQKRHGDVSARISLNAGAAQEIRAEKLRELALNLAAQVKSNGKTVTLGAKSPQERRVIHLTLDGIEGVGTRSVGTGESRKLIVFSSLPEHQNNRGRREGQPGRSSHARQGHNRAGGNAKQPQRQEARTEEGRGEGSRSSRRRRGQRRRGPREGTPQGAHSQSPSGASASSTSSAAGGQPRAEKPERNDRQVRPPVTPIGPGEA